MRKDALLAFLMNQTDFFDPENVSEVFTARYLAQRFNMQRNTASHYLNQLVAQGVLCKINTRPVYFLHKQAFSQQFFILSRNEYASVAELLAHGEQECAPDDHFSLLIGHNESLKRPIEQLKTALFYSRRRTAATDDRRKRYREKLSGAAHARICHCPGASVAGCAIYQF